MKRTSVQEVFQFIEDECDAIMDKIPADYTKLGDYALPTEQPETGRANRLAVLALKARTALYAASELFNPEQKGFVEKQLKPVRRLLIHVPNMGIN